MWLSADPPEIKSIAASVHTKLGLNTQIECHANAEPTATVHWFHHGIPLLQNGRISRLDAPIMPIMPTVGDEPTFATKHILSIRAMKESDLGVYECRAENKLGFKGATVELTGRPMPSIFKKSPIMSKFLTHNLIWQTESLSPIIEYKLKFRQVPSGNITPMNRHHPTHWNELIIPAEMSESKWYPPMMTTISNIFNDYFWQAQFTPLATRCADYSPPRSTRHRWYHAIDLDGAIIAAPYNLQRMPKVRFF